ncbi:MAG: hypothetical protein HY709_09035 [Candidatus Latescibacteria bacterium]|nr:hypothetical protein [Candidatus Latescibacterota bacterium]
MGFWEALALVGTMATILGLFLTIYAIINNRTLKEESRLTRETIIEESRLTREMIIRLGEKMDTTLNEIARLIVAEGERTRQAINPS